MIQDIGGPKPDPVVLHDRRILILVSLDVPGDLVLELAEVLFHTIVEGAQLLPDVLSGKLVGLLHPGVLTRCRPKCSKLDDRVVFLLGVADQGHRTARGGTLTTAAGAQRDVHMLGSRV